MGNKSLNSNAKSFGGINQRPSTVNARPVAPKAPTALNQRPVTPVQAKAVAMPQPQKTVTSPNVAKQPVSGNNAANQEVNAFVESMKSMVGSFAIISDEVVANNSRLAGGQGMSIDDRTIPFECAQYIMSNFAFICMGIVCNEDFKDSFISAITAEHKIDALDEEDKKAIRATMTDPNPYKSEGSIVLGMTTFTQPIEEQLHREMMKGFDKLQPFSKEFDEAVFALNDEQKMANGFIFSNWMYLIRAFTHNDMFMSYVITVIDEVKSRLGIQ